MVSGFRLGRCPETRTQSLNFIGKVIKMEYFFKLNFCILISPGNIACCRLKKVKVATVDSFQGGERDIIILSCVRTDQMGFVDDMRYVSL